MESGQGQDGEGEGVFLINQGVMRGMWEDKGRGWGTGWGGREPPQVAALNWRNRRREVEREKTPERRAFQLDVSGVMLRRPDRS